MNAGNTQAQDTINIQNTDGGKMHRPGDKDKQGMLCNQK